MMHFQANYITVRHQLQIGRFFSSSATSLPKLHYFRFGGDNNFLFQDLKKLIYRPVPVRRQHPVVSILQIDKHGILGLFFLDHTLYRNRNLWRNRHELMGHTTRIGEVSNDESSHTRKRGYRPSKVFTLRLFEIK